MLLTVRLSLACRRRAIEVHREDANKIARAQPRCVLQRLRKNMDSAEVAIVQMRATIDELGAKLRQLPDTAAKLALLQRWRQMTTELADIAIAADAVLWD